MCKYLAVGVLNTLFALWNVFNKSISIFVVFVFLCGSVVEHCVSSAKGCGLDSQGTHILMKMYNLNAIVSCFG